MPNWVFNTLTIQGPKEQVDFIKKKLNTPYQKTFENWNTETQQMEFKEYLFPNPVFAFHNIYNHIEDGVSDEIYLQQPDHSLDIKEALLFKGNHWYDWNVRNWGTKWDVGVSWDEEYPDTELLEHESKDEDQWLVYKFNTAWSPPTPAMEKLSALVPNCVVTLDFEEEQGWGGEYEFVNGEMTAESNYGWKCRECDNEEEDTPYCETCEFDMCPACGYGEPMDEDRAQCEEHREPANVN